MMRRRRRIQKVALNQLKIEYVVVWGMGIHELGTFLCASKLVWVYRFLKSDFFFGTKSY